LDTARYTHRVALANDRRVSLEGDRVTFRYDRRAVLEIAGDPAIARGGCVVEFDGGEVDARIETQLAAFAAALAERSA
jgi:flagellar biosynthesis/type III secretory pathway protein FliH